MAQGAVPNPGELSRRERQVVEILARDGQLSARKVQERLPAPPTYSAVRSILRILGEKHFVRKQRAEGKDLFSLQTPAAETRKSLLKGLVDKLFSNSVSDAACALLSAPEVKLSAKEAENLIRLIREAKKR